MRVSGSCDTRHLHGLDGIAVYVVVRIRPGLPGGGGEVRG